MFNNTPWLRHIKSRHVLLVLLVVIVLFPPFSISYPSGAVVGAGYGFILNPPDDRARIDIPVLLAEVALLLIAYGIYVGKDRGRE